VTVYLDFEVSTVRQQRTGFDVDTSAGGYVPDPTVHLGETAAWGPAPAGKPCDLVVLDSNAKFKVSYDDWKLHENVAQTCKEKVKTIAQAFYETMQPR
jgi:hypothetical protein